MPSAKLTSKGQITIPREIRRALKLSPGDRLDFIVGSSGEVTVRPGSFDVLALKGLLSRSGRRPVSLTEMDAAIARQHGRRK